MTTIFFVIAIFISSWVFVDFIGYWLHRWSHVNGSILYKKHMTHHMTNYPAKRFLSERYRSSGADSLGVWFAPFFVIYCLIMFFLFPNWIAIPAMLGAIPPSVLSTTIHDLTHIKDSYIWKNENIKFLAQGHYAHHRNMKKNFGITSFFWDRMFKTYWDSFKDPVS